MKPTKKVVKIIRQMKTASTKKIVTDLVSLMIVVASSRVEAR
jgi:hypothetical protein